jgi:hypothetical protein
MTPSWYHSSKRNVRVDMTMQSAEVVIARRLEIIRLPLSTQSTQDSGYAVAHPMRILLKDALALLYTLQKWDCLALETLLLSLGSLFHLLCLPLILQLFPNNHLSRWDVHVLRSFRYLTLLSLSAIRPLGLPNPPPVRRYRVVTFGYTIG